MGYSGLTGNWDSDMASATANSCVKAVIKVLKREVKLKENEYNTDGIVNVAFMFDELVVPSMYKLCWGYYDEMREIAEKVFDGLEVKIQDCKDYLRTEDPNDDNTHMHIRHYRRLKRSVGRFLKECT